MRTDTRIESRTRDRAYAIWEAEGRPEGRATDHWLAAETECRAKPARAGRMRTSTNAAAKRSPSSATATKTKASNGR